MKKKSILIGLLLISITVLAQERKESKTKSALILLKADQWRFQTDKVKFIDYKGMKAMKIEKQSEQVVLKDLIFKNGIIEYDIETTPNSVCGFYFRRKSDKDSEYFYIRPGRAEKNNDAVQYAPIIHSVNLWDLQGEFQGPAPLKFNEWNHVKLIVSGFQMRVYINQSTKPTLEIPYLEADSQEGGIAFDGESIIANLIVRPNIVEGLAAYEGTDLTNHDANYLRQWSVISKAIPLPKGTELYKENLPDTDSILEKINAERRGLINLTRKFGRSEQRRFVWLKVIIISNTEQKNLIQLGFSDEVWVFMNKQMVFVDKNLYSQNMRKYPDGRISILNSSFPVQLKPGKNELLIGVANDFYGWGIIARLESLNGIEIEK